MQARYQKCRARYWKYLTTATTNASSRRSPDTCTISATPSTAPTTRNTAFNILRSLDINPKDIALIVGAIGHHDEKTAAPVSPIAAALILADKSDVRRSRVRNSKTVSTDIHDRVNYAVVDSELEVDGEDRVIILRLKIDTDICPVMEYFEIFLERMVLCKKSAARLDCSFELIINDTRLL